MLLGCLCFGIATCANAQHLPFQVFDQKDGLPEDRVRAIQQDDDGFIWLLCGNSLLRFDGYTFRSFNLGDESYEGLFKDSKGKLWMHGVGRHLAYIENNEVVDYPYNSVLKTLRKSGIKSFYVDQNETVWLGLSNPSHCSTTSWLTIDTSGSIDSSNMRAGNTTWLIKPVDDTLLYAVKYGSLKPKDSLKLQIIDHTGDTQYCTMPNFLEKQLYSIKGRPIIVTRYQGVHDIGAKASQYPMFTGLRFRNVYTDRQARVWIPLETGGAFCFENSSLTDAPLHFLEKERVTTVFQSEDHGIWLGTIDGKLFFSPTLETWVYDAQMGLPHGILVSSSTAPDGHWLVYKEGLVSRISPNSKEVSTFNFRTLLQTMHMFPKERKVLLGTPYTPQIPEDFPYPTVAINSLRKMVPNAEGQYAFSGGRAIHEWNVSTDELLRTHMIGFKPDALCALGSKHYLLSDTRGLYVYENKELTSLADDHKILSSHITDIIAFDDSWYICHSATYGVFALKYQSGTQMCYPLWPSTSEVSQCIVQSSDGYLWLMKANSIEQLEPFMKNDSVQLRRIQRFSHAQGLPKQRMVHLSIDSQYLWVATAQGLTQISRKQSSSLKSLKPVQILNVQHQGEPVQVSEGMGMEYGNGKTSFTVSSPQYLHTNEVNYRYQLVGSREKWNSTHTGQIHFEQLVPGTYQLQVQAYTMQGLYSPITHFPFTISPLYWQTLGFKLAMVCLVLALTAALLVLRYNRLKRRKHLIAEIKSYRNKSLRLQMNPHFMYNTLGSIQSFVMKEESRLSSKYIARFSKLMRLIFEHNTKELITLNQELEALQLYIELETLRRKDPLSFEMDVAASLQPAQTLVPPMLLQPLVENSIQHAFSDSIVNGIISLQISAKNGGLHFTVRDNGAWSKKSSKPNSRVSGGVITSDRIALFNQERQYEGTMNVQQLEGLGTQVTFSIAHITTN